MRNKQEYTKLVASDLISNPGFQIGGWIDLVESLQMLENPSQPEAKTVVSCSCSSPPAQGTVSASRDVVSDVRWQEGSTSSRSDVYR